MGVILSPFKTKQPYFLFLLPIIAVVFWLKWFLNPSINVDTHALMPLAEAVLYLSSHNLILIGIFSLFSVLVTSYLLYYINERYHILREGSNLPSFIYLLLACVFSFNIGFSPIIFTSLFLLCSFERLLSSYNKHNSVSSFFDAGFFVGIAIGFNLYAITFLFLGIISLILFSRLNFRSLVSILLGVILPLLFIWTYYFCMGEQQLLVDKISFISSINSIIVVYSFYEYIYIALVVFLLLVSIMSLFLRNTLKEVFETKFFLLLFWIFIIALIVQFLNLSNGSSFLYIVSIPSSFFMARYFSVQKHKWYGDMLFLIFLISTMLIQFQDILKILIPYE